jgi:cation:H+ antiporter
VTGLLLLAAAAVLLAYGADLFAENAARAGRQLGVSTLAVGLLLAGAEPEEMVTGLLAALRGRPGIAAGDAIGANVTMLTLVLGLAAAVYAVPFRRELWPYAGSAIAAGVPAAVLLRDGLLTRREAGALLFLYLVTVAVVWWRERRPPAFGELAETSNEVARRPALAVAAAFAGIALMTLGGRLAVDGAVRVVEVFGATDGAVGLTVVALATTAELLALVVAARRHDVPELAVAGVLGSAVYNATVTLGVAALARPLAVPHDVRVVAWAAASLPVLLVLLAFRRRRLGRAAGALLLAGYAGYLTLVLRA